MNQFQNKWAQVAPSAGDYNSKLLNFINEGLSPENQIRAIGDNRSYDRAAFQNMKLQDFLELTPPAAASASQAAAQIAVSGQQQFAAQTKTTTQ